MKILMIFSTHFRFLGLALALGAAVALPAAEENTTKTGEWKRVELKLVLPDSDVMGITPPIHGIGKFDTEFEVSKRKPVFIPKKANKNIALNKPVTSSSLPSYNELTCVTDGEKDAGEGFEVELDEGLQWIQIDLQKRSNIYAIALWHFHRQRRAYKNVIIQISDDPTFKRDVTTVFNTDSKNIEKFGIGQDRHYVETNYGKIVIVLGTAGRYVRLYSHGNSANKKNHYIEVEVYGYEAQQAAPVK